MTEAPVRYDGPAGRRDALVEALRRVVDPEVGLSIVDIGLVYGIRLDDAGCTVELTTTSAACPLGDLIVADVEDALGAVLAPGTTIDVALVREPPWTPERMSESARQRMRW